MTLQSSKKFLSGLTAMLLAVSSTIPSFASLPVQAKGETDASWIYAVNGAEETKKNPVELLVGVNNPAITGSTLQDSLFGYEVVYLMNGAIGVNDLVKLESEEVTGIFRVYKLVIDGDNIEGDWQCTAQLVEVGG